MSSEHFDFVCVSDRIRLKYCCNATGALFLTKHNTAVSQEIPYETNMKLTHIIDEELHKMLPEVRACVSLLNARLCVCTVMVSCVM